MTDVEDATLFVGICGLALKGQEFALPFGITLRDAQAHVAAPLMVKGRPAPEGEIGVAWYLVHGSSGHDITAEAVIPISAAKSHADRAELVRTLMFLMRLWVDPAIHAPTVAFASYSELHTEHDSNAPIFPHELKRRYFELEAGGPYDLHESIGWIATHFQAAHRLLHAHAEFALAADALTAGQFVENHALTLISLWGGLEALFSPSPSELRFRVSALIAAYRFPPGPKRLEAQRSIAQLYDKRSAAAHGKPKHQPDDLLRTFELVREVLIKMVVAGAVPTKGELEASLFGA